LKSLYDYNSEAIRQLKTDIQNLRQDMFSLRRQIEQLGFKETEYQAKLTALKNEIKEGLNSTGILFNSILERVRVFNNQHEVQL
jgi:peptidoglycan hydrolase CwlO-like protein